MSSLTKSEAQACASAWLGWARAITLPDGADLPPILQIHQQPIAVTASPGRFRDMIHEEHGD